MTYNRFFFTTALACVIAGSPMARSVGQTNPYTYPELPSHQLEQGLYTRLNDKSWSQILEENTLKWNPPKTVNLLIQPIHSPSWIYVNPSMTVSGRYVTENVSKSNRKSCEAAKNQEDLVVQFAFDDPVFIPDYKLTNLRLEENKYPVAVADYFANDMFYQIEYIATALDNEQTLLCVNVAVKNEGEHRKEAHVRVKVGYYPENEIFDYHYIPFNWDVTRWKPYNGVSLDSDMLYKQGNIIGQVDPQGMSVVWENYKQCSDKEYLDVLYPQVWYGSGFALPKFRLKEIRDVIHASHPIDPGETTGFSIKLLVNDNNITPTHIESLSRLSTNQIKAQALESFKQQFNDQTLALAFPTNQWDDILTTLQINIAQLLVNYPDREDLMPTQGGSSERFYVWVFEAVMMLRPLLRTGQFDLVKQALDFIFALQDAGFPPAGRFTTTEGSIGTTGHPWACTTGIALALACDYYLYSKDNAFINNYLDKIIKAMNWIAGQVKATRVMNEDGTRPLTYGLMPYAVASDGDAGYFVGVTDVYSFYGLDKSVRLLEDIQHPQAEHMRQELEQYKQDILVAIGHLTRPDGFIDRKLVIGDDKNQEAVKFTNTDIMAPIATVGIMDPTSETFQNYLNYYETKVAENYFLGQMDRDIFYMIQSERYWQPIYLMLGEWKKAFMAFQVCMNYAITHDTHQTQERFDRRNPFFAPFQPNGSGNGGIMEMMLNCFCFEQTDYTSFLAGVPFDYLLANKTTYIRNLYTLQGILNITVNKTGENKCELVISSSRELPQKIRIPSFLGPKAQTKGVKKSGNDIFTLTKTTNEVRFTLTGDNQ